MLGDVFCMETLEQKEEGLWLANQLSEELKKQFKERLISLELRGPINVSEYDCYCYDGRLISGMFLFVYYPSLEFVNVWAYRKITREECKEICTVIEDFYNEPEFKCEVIEGDKYGAYIYDPNKALSQVNLKIPILMDLAKEIAVNNRN